MGQIALSKCTEKGKKVARFFFVERLRVFSLTTGTTVTSVTTVKKNTFSDFWKEQFDTFDNQCDVLRAAFCDSRDVSLSYPCVSPRHSPHMFSCFVGVLAGQRNVQAVFMLHAFCWL